MTVGSGVLAKFPDLGKGMAMLAKRLLVAIILVPLFVGVGYLGGLPFSLFISVLIGVAAWEFARIFNRESYKPSIPVIVAGASLIVLVRDQSPFGFDGSAFVLSIFIMVGITVHLIDYERGNDRSAINFCITLTGLVYLGWLGKYLVLLRALPDGLWWLLLVIPAVWLGDVGGFLIGSRFGKHKMTPRLSPKKSWEGYIGGVIFAALGTGLLTLLWQLQAPQVTFDKGFIMGLVIGIFTPLGDLGESMIKRQFGLKDSSSLLPGHGGVFDRIDSWLWAGVIGYYVIVIFCLSV
jgi:phosphatidate cytidylyltransferase